MSVSFDDYDFENDLQFQAHLRNVELLADNQEAQLTRLKAKWYRKHIDPTFELPARASTRAEGASDAVRQREATARAAQEADAGPTPDANMKMKSGEVLLLAVGFLFALGLSIVLRRADLPALVFRLFMHAVLASCLTRLYLTVGFPKVWPFDFQRLKIWGSRIAGTSDFHYGMVAVMFGSTRPDLAVMVGPCILMGLRLSSFIKRSVPQLTTLMPLCEWTLDNRERLFYYAAIVDIAALAPLVIGVFTSRKILLPFVYLNMLRSRYVSPASARYHQAAWGSIANAVQPYYSRAPAAVQQVIQVAVRWFTRSGAPR